MVTRTLTHTPQITQAAALEAIRGNQSVLEVTRNAYRARRNRIHAALTEVTGISCILPDGGMFVFPCVTALLGDNSAGLNSSAELATWLLEFAHVAVVPGEAFQAPGHLRINFAVGDDELDEAAGRLQAALHSLTTPSDLTSTGLRRCSHCSAVAHKCGRNERVARAFWGCFPA